MAGEIMEERILELMTAFKGLNNSDMLEGCSQSEFNTLVTIEQIEAEKVNVNKIAESLKVSMPAVSKTLKNLESKKLIKRKIDVFCRRNTFVELTAKGKKVLEKNIKQINDVLVKAFGSELNNTIDFLIEVGKKLNLVQSERGDLNACVE